VHDECQPRHLGASEAGFAWSLAVPHRAPQHRPPGWRPAAKHRDPAHRRYHTRAWEQVRRLVVARDGGLCTLCRGPGNTVDHLREVRDGGTDEMGNLRLLCAACHNRRHREKGRV
jgi:5-methylcytosine-specific restriction enzyme A